MNITIRKIPKAARRKPTVAEMSTEDMLMFRAAVYGIVALNSITGNYASDLVDKLADDPRLYRFKVKFACKNIERETDKGNRKIISRMEKISDFRFLADIGRLLCDGISRDITILRMSISSALRKAGVRDEGSLRSDALTALTLADMAEAYARRCADTLAARPYFIRSATDVRASLLDIIPVGLFRQIRILKGLLCTGPDVVRDVSIDDDKQCRDAAMVILNRLSDPTVLSNAIDGAERIREEENNKLKTEQNEND